MRLSWHCLHEPTKRHFLGANLQESRAGFSVVPAPEGATVRPGRDIDPEGICLSYRRTPPVQGGMIVITYSGALSGDTFTGTANVGGTKTGYTGVRIKGTQGSAGRLQGELNRSAI